MSSSNSSPSTSGSHHFYGMNISSDDTLAYPNVSRIQSPKRAYSWGHHRPDYQGKVHNKVSEERERDDTIVPASHGYITTGTPYHEAESNVLKRIYRLSQQTFNDFAANWNGDYRESRRRRYDRRSKIMDSSRLQRDLEDPDCNIEMHPVSTNSSLEDKKKLLALMSQCLVRSGCPSHRIESSLDQTARYLEVEAAFSYVPGQMTISFGNAITTSSHTVLIKVHQGHDMKKLAVVDDVANALCRSEIPVHDCLVELEEIHHSPPTWGSWATILAFTICSSTSCLVMFGGSWSDALVSALLGFLVGALNVLASHHSVYSNVFEVSASAAVAVISRSLFKWVCFSKVALSAVIVLLPGYSMTVAVMELSARQIAAGTIRFVYSVIYAFILGYGLQIGSSLYGTLNPVSDSTGLCEPGISEWYYVPLLPLLAISIAMTFGASVKQWPSMIVCCIIAFIIVFFLNKVITDYQIAASISAFAIGLYANLALKVTRTPPLVPLCCGITLLVPGGIGVRGAYHLLMDDDPDGSAFALNMHLALRGSVMAIMRWPPLRRQSQPASPPNSNEDSNATLQDAATPIRRNHTALHMPNVFTKFMRRPSISEHPEIARRASVLQTADATRQSEEAERRSITQDLEVMFDTPDQDDNHHQISERRTSKNAAETDTEYRYWRLQGGAGRRNAEMVPIQKDWSSIPPPFKVKPRILDDGHYIEPPVIERNFFDPPAPSIISNMTAPYPLLRKQRIPHLSDQTDSDTTVYPYWLLQQQQNPTKQSRRHSLSWGKMDKLIHENRNDDDAHKHMETSTSTSTAGSRPWDSMRRMMSSKNKSNKSQSDKKGKSRVIDINLLPKTESQKRESLTAESLAEVEGAAPDRPTIKILVQEPHPPHSPTQHQSNDFLHVINNHSAYDADVDSIDDRASDTSKPITDGSAL